MKEADAVHVSPALNAAGDGWDLAVTIDNQNALGPMDGGTVTVLEPSNMAGTLPLRLLRLIRVQLLSFRLRR